MLSPQLLARVGFITKLYDLIFFFFMVVKAWQESSADGDIFEWAWMPWAHNADTDPHPAQIGSDTSTFFST